MHYKILIPYIISATALLPGTASNEIRDTDTENNNKNKIENVTDSVRAPERDTIPAVAPSMPVRIEQQGKSVIYVYNDGKRVVRAKGTRAWRNNNPGNLRYYDFAKSNGAIGEAGAFAVFPNEETGMRALYKLLQTDSYINLTIKNALKRYDPVTWPVYTRKLTRLTGLSPDVKLHALNASQLETVAKTIRQLEGWIVGQEHEINTTQVAMTRINKQNTR